MQTILSFDNSEFSPFIHNTLILGRIDEKQTPDVREKEGVR